MRNKAIYLILHNIRSAFNVGSIFRTADAAGVSKIYLCGITPTPNGEKSKIKNQISKLQFKNQNFGAAQKIAKVALGAERVMPWECAAQTWRILKKLKREGYVILALEQHPKSKNLFKYIVRHNKVALVLGQEVKGLSPAILKYADEILEIPMYGHKESLNVAVATGIALYSLI